MYVTKRKGRTILAFKYYIKSAASSFARNGIMTIASFITIACCLFLFGVFMLFSLNVTSISQQIEQQCKLTVRIDINADARTEKDVYERILNIDNVTDAYLETKEQAFSNFKTRLGDKAKILEGLENEDFLRSSVIIILDDIRNTDSTINQLKGIRGIAEVEDHRDLVSKIVSFTSASRTFSVVAMIVLMLIAVFIIQNTIKLSVFAREKEIHIMKFVGATDNFIRIPFIIEGIFIGLLGFLVSFLIIAFGYSSVTESVTSFTSLFDFVPIEQCVFPLGISMVLFGVLMGAVGSALSLKRYLKV